MTRLFYLLNRVVDTGAERRARSSRKILSIEDVFLNNIDVPLSYGYAKISYPANRSIAEQNYALNSLQENSLTTFQVSEYQIVTTPEAFHGLIDEHYPNKQNYSLIYIHGLDNSFNEAAERLGQASVDTHIAGMPILFSWPSDVARIDRYYPYNVVSERQYKETQAIALRSYQYAVVALDEIYGATRRFGLMAHSMGTDIAANALVLRELRAITGSISTVGLADAGEPHSVIFAAQDISTREFEQSLGPRITRNDRWLAVYCGNDIALHFSQGYNRSDERLGYCPMAKPPLNGVDSVHIVGRTEDFMRHSYFLSSPQIIEDMTAVLDLPGTPQLTRPPASGRVREIVLR
jgi:esterase/lipase superfamily enzyme